VGAEFTKTEGAEGDAKNDKKEERGGWRGKGLEVGWIVREWDTVDVYA